MVETGEPQPAPCDLVDLTLVHGLVAAAEPTISGSCAHFLSLPS